MLKTSSRELSRRELLRLGLATTTASVLMGGFELTSPSQVRASVHTQPECGGR